MMGSVGYCFPFSQNIDLTVGPERRYRRLTPKSLSKVRKVPF